MAIWLHVDTRSGIPLYMQLIEQIRHALDIGILRAGDALPTVRELASELTIAPNTIVKAYNELQRMGLIESRPGKGTVVVDHLEGVIRQQQIEACYRRLSEIVRDAHSLGIDADELRARFETEIQHFFDEYQHQEKA